MCGVRHARGYIWTYGEIRKEEICSSTFENLCSTAAQRFLVESRKIGSKLILLKQIGFGPIVKILNIYDRYMCISSTEEVLELRIIHSGKANEQKP